VISMAKDRDYHFLGAEFGTYSPIRVLGALRQENRTHFFSPHDSTAHRRAKNELLECFCPASPSWRGSVVKQSVELIQRAQHAACTLASING
jgi:hypothetical protein